MKLALLLPLLILISCNVSRQRSSHLQAREKTGFNEIINAYEEISTKEVDLDRKVLARTGSEAFVEIIPRGTFRILPDGTFEGEAEEIRTFRRDTTVRNEDERSNLREDDHRRSGHEDRRLSTYQTLEIAEESKTRRRPGWEIGLFWIAVVSLVFLVLRSRLKRFRIF